MDKPLVFLKCLIQLISDIASILPDLHCVIVSTPITVEGLGAAGKSFFIICTDFKTVQDSALLRCKTLHFYFAIHTMYYENKILVITTNLQFSQWNHVFGDPILTEAVIDRLIHHSHLLLFNGESFRYKKSLLQQ